MSEIKYNLSRKRDNILIWVAHHIPRRLAMRVFFDVLGHATSGKYGKTIVPNITAMEAADRFMKDHNL